MTNDAPILKRALAISSSDTRNAGASSESDKQARLPKKTKKILKLVDSYIEWDNEASLEDLQLLLQKERGI